MEPYAVDGSIVVPVRQIAEAFDVPVVWDEAAQQATVQRGEETLVLRLGSQTALYNGVEVPLPIKPQTKADVTFCHCVTWRSGCNYRWSLRTARPIYSRRTRRTDATTV